METITCAACRIDWALVLSAITAAIALVALIYTARTHRREVDAARRAQASLVAVWPLGWTITHNASFYGYEPFQAVVYNGSNLPVYTISIELLPVDWRENPTPLMRPAIGLLTPETTSNPIDFGRLEGPPDRTPGLPPPPPPLRLTFVDNAGVRWTRHPDGRLEESKTQKR